MVSSLVRKLANANRRLEESRRRYDASRDSSLVYFAWGTMIAPQIGASDGAMHCLQWPREAQILSLRVEDLNIVG